MPPHRFEKQTKQDHSVYVQLLFKDFLTRNSRNPATGVPHDTRTIIPHQERASSGPRKQPGIFDRAVYARFERNATNDGFTRLEPAVGLKTGLMKWIDHQRNQNPQQNVVTKVTRSEDYLNLPGNFLSGTERMELPFEPADKTLVNVTNNFVPPATSTPFDRLSSFGTSGVLSDPDEFQSDRPNAHNANEWDNFLKSCEEYLIDVTKRKGSDLLDQQRDELKALLQSGESTLKDHAPKQSSYEPEAVIKPQHVVTQHESNFGRLSWRDHSLLSNQNYCLDQSREDDLPAPQPIPDPFDTFLDVSLKEPPTTRKKRNNVTFLIDKFSQSPSQSHVDDSRTQDDMLLTASPPSPSSSTTNRRMCDGDTFLLGQASTEDSLMEKLDALLDEEFKLDNDFDFTTPPNQITMNVSFPNHFQHINDTLDASLANRDLAGSPLYFSQDFMMAPTMPKLRDSLF